VWELSHSFAADAKYIDTGLIKWYNIMKFYMLKAGSDMKIFSRIILTVLAVLLTVVLTVTSLSASLISCIRVHFSPQYVYNFMNSIDYASLELPDGEGNVLPLCDIINSQVREFGIYFTEDDVNDLIHTFSIDAVIASYMQDVRSWAMDDGPVPMLDSAEVAEMITTGLDNSLYMFLGLFGNPRVVLADAISGMVSAADFSALFERGNLIPAVLASDALIFAISLCGSVFLLILFTQKLRLIPTGIYTGISCILSGSVMLFARQIIAPFKAQLFASPDMLPEEVFDMVYMPFMGTVHRTGTFVSLGGLAVLVVFAVIGSFYAMYARERDRALLRQNRAMNFGTPYAQFDYNMPDYMAQGFENASAEEQWQSEPVAEDTPVAEETLAAEDTSVEESPASEAEDNKDTEY